MKLFHTILLLFTSLTFFSTHLFSISSVRTLEKDGHEIIIFGDLHLERKDYQQHIDTFLGTVGELEECSLKPDVTIPVICEVYKKYDEQVKGDGSTFQTLLEWNIESEIFLFEDFDPREKFSSFNYMFELKSFLHHIKTNKKESFSLKEIEKLIDSHTFEEKAIKDLLIDIERILEKIKKNPKAQKEIEIITDYLNTLSTLRIKNNKASLKNWVTKHIQETTISENKNLKSDALIQSIENFMLTFITPFSIYFDQKYLHKLMEDIKKHPAQIIIVGENHAKKISDLLQEKGFELIEHKSCYSNNNLLEESECYAKSINDLMHLLPSYLFDCSF